MPYLWDTTLRLVFAYLAAVALKPRNQLNTGPEKASAELYTNFTTGEFFNAFVIRGIAVCFALLTTAAHQVCEIPAPCDYRQFVDCAD